ASMHQLPVAEESQGYVFRLKLLLQNQKTEKPFAKQAEGRFRVRPSPLICPGGLRQFFGVGGAVVHQAAELILGAERPHTERQGEDFANLTRISLFPSGQ